MFKKECCKQCTYVKFKGTMTKWPVKNQHTNGLQTLNSINPSYMVNVVVIELNNCILTMFTTFSIIPPFAFTLVCKYSLIETKRIAWLFFITTTVVHGKSVITHRASRPVAVFVWWTTRLAFCPSSPIYPFTRMTGRTTFQATKKQK